MTEAEACCPGDFGKSSARDKMNTHDMTGYLKKKGGGGGGAKVWRPNQSNPKGNQS